MKHVLAALRTLLVLALALGALVAVAWLAGELPARDAVVARHRAEEARRAEAHERAARAAREAARREEAADAGVDAAVVEAPRTPRHRICDDANAAGLMRTRLDARGRELLAVSCGDRLTVLGFVDATPLAVAELSPVAANQTAPVRRYTLVADDVTGDGVLDWVVGTTRSVDVSSPAVGSLHLVPGDARGGLGEPQLLAPLAVAGIDVGRADDDEVLDLVVLHRPDTVGARAPEAWVFRGGAAMVRIARVPMPTDTTAVALVDLDVDGKADLLPLRSTAGSTRALAGDGTGGFARTFELTLPAAQGFSRALSAASGSRLLLPGPTPSWLLPGTPAPTVVQAELPASPVAEDLRGGSQGDDARIAWLSDGVVRWFETTASGTNQRASVTLPSAEGRIADVAVGDFAGGTDADLALLIEAPGGVQQRDLLLMIDLADGEHLLHLADERGAIAPAPMHLTIPLR